VIWGIWGMGVLQTPAAARITICDSSLHSATSKNPCRKNPCRKTHAEKIMPKKPCKKALAIAKALVKSENLICPTQESANLGIDRPNEWDLSRLF
jgi:hypothetical protein